jgi:hypothetical protein
MNWPARESQGIYRIFDRQKSGKGEFLSDLAEPLSFSRTATRMMLVVLQARSRVSRLLSASFAGFACGSVEHRS